MTTLSTMPDLYSCGYRLEDDGQTPGELAARASATDDPGVLARHMAEDGYLWLRGALDKDEVCAARHCILEQLARDGQLDPAAPLMTGTPKPGARLSFEPALAQKNNPPLQHLLYHPQGNLMRFFASFLGGPVRHFDFTWLRCVSPGHGTPSHCDIVYMGRGTRRLYTAWVPLGVIDYEMGGLMILEDSHRNERLRETYGQRDVDSYCENRAGDSARTANGLNGWLSRDPNRIRRSLGGRWLTAEYRPGDMVVFSMDLVHGGVDNRSSRLRISSDSRYQLAAEPIDERWVGANPAGHGTAGKRGRVC